jgi:hypothetical protein
MPLQLRLPLEDGTQLVRFLVPFEQLHEGEAVCGGEGEGRTKDGRGGETQEGGKGSGCPQVDHQIIKYGGCDG